MVTYSIKDLEKLSGIKAHTIRIWEQRYHIIEPQRTTTNIRYYTDDDLKCLLNIAFLNKNGIRISQIARMTRDEISQKVQTIAQANTENANQLQALTMAMIDLNEEKVLHIIQTGIEQWGFDTTVQRLFIPFLEKLTLLWLTGSISTVHEQFIHAIIRQKILAVLDQLPRSKPTSPYKFMLYLPKAENNDLEIVLLLMRYMLQRQGHSVLYLGIGLSLQDVALAYNIHQPSHLYTILSEPRNKSSLPEYLHKLATSFPQASILVSGYRGDMPENVDTHHLHLVENFDAAIDYMEELSTALSAQGHS